MGLDCLHSAKICHNDIKLENILIKCDSKNNTEILKISDFGNAVDLEDTK